MLNSVQAQVAFLNDEWRDRQELARIYTRETRHANTSKREVEIFDARPLHTAGELSLDTNGFILVEQASAFQQFDDKAAVESEYFEEMRQLAMTLTGAVDALVFPFYQVRSKSAGNFFGAYSLYVHCDFSPGRWHDMAQQVVRDYGAGKQYPAGQFDFALYNLWRPIRNEVQRDPLALIDASTMGPTDILEYRLSPKDDAVAALPLFNAAQRFYYMSRMQTNEILVFKQQDSRSELAQVCPHTSFVDPTAAPDAVERQSVEVRVICVFPK